MPKNGIHSPWVHQKFNFRFVLSFYDEVAPLFVGGPRWHRDTAMFTKVVAQFQSPAEETSKALQEAMKGYCDIRGRQHRDRHLNKLLKQHEEDHFTLQVSRRTVPTGAVFAIRRLC